MKPAALLHWQRKSEPQGVVTRPYLPLDRALLCCGCEAVFEAADSQSCPACGSHQAIALGRVLGEARKVAG